MLEPRGGLEESLTSSGSSRRALSTEPFEAAGWTAAGEKCGQTETRADEQDQRCCWPAFHTGKTIAGCTGEGEEEERPGRRGSRGGAGGEVEGGGSINGPLYCFVLLKLRAQISWQHFNHTSLTFFLQPGFCNCFRLQEEPSRRLLADGAEAGGGHTAQTPLQFPSWVPHWAPH